MPLRIISASEPMTVDTIVLTLYGVPGLGKSSLGYSADAPLLLDADGGAYRSAFRKATAPADTWSDIADITAQDVAPYKTLVLDTTGRALDLLATDIIAGNPKLGRGGALTLQGYGELKSRFTSYLRLMRSFGLDIVLIAHSDEKQQGDEMVERIDMQGASKNEVYKSSDAMARLTLANGQRVLSFAPSDTRFGKDPANLGTVSVPHLNEHPQFLGDLIRRIKDSLNAESAAQLEAAAEAAAWQAKITEASTPEAFTALVSEAKTKIAKRQLNDAATAKGFAFDKNASAFVKPVIDREPGEDDDAGVDTETPDMFAEAGA